MTYPVFVQLVQISHGSVRSASIAIQRMFQNVVSELDDFGQHAGCIPMIATAADYGLKSRREESIFIEFQRPGANGARKQIRKDAGKAKHPDFEVTSRKIDRTSRFERANGHPHQSEDGILRFVLREKSIDQFNQTAGTHGAVVILKELHGGIQQVRRLDSHEVPILFFEKLNSGVRQRLE